MKVTVLGAGRWASCIAYCLNRNKHNVLMWDLSPVDGKEINPLFINKKNEFMALPKGIELTHDLTRAVNFGEVIVISILSQKLDEFMQSIKKISGYQNKKYCLNMKGVECTTGRRLSEILLDNGVKKENIAVWVGPGHVQSIYAGQPTNMIISAYHEAYAHFLIKNFSKPNVLDIAYSNDIIGVEIGAAAKNVIGIAAGILEGSNMEQKKGPLMPASVREIGMFIDALGGDPLTAQGLAFLGDFQATLFDHNSKNLTYGKAIVENKALSGDFLHYNIMSVEGIKTAQALIKKMEEFNNRVNEEKQIKMPITAAVKEITTGKIPLENAGKYISEKITEAINLE